MYGPFVIMATKRAGEEAGWIRKIVPWAVILALSSSLAYVMNTAAVGALSAEPPTAANATTAEGAANPCALDADGALYARWDRWIPAGRSGFCRGDTYPGVAGRNDVASQLRDAGGIQATVTFLAPTDTRVNLYCAASSHQTSTEADFVSATDARLLYARVCTPAP